MRPSSGSGSLLVGKCSALTAQQASKRAAFDIHFVHIRHERDSAIALSGIRREVCAARGETIDTILTIGEVSGDRGIVEANQGDWISGEA
jgi:hypothetical protein